MPVTLQVRDEATTGQVYHEAPLEFPTERITIRELIRARVYQEVQDFNRNREEKAFRGLVQPNDTERVLNNNRQEFKLKKHRTIDWKTQYEKATKAFDQNGFLILINDAQAESLDQEFDIRNDTRVSFVKLTLLVGG